MKSNIQIRKDRQGTAKVNVKYVSVDLCPLGCENLPLGGDKIKEEKVVCSNIKGKKANI